MEAKPRIVTTSHVFVPMLLPLLKWVKPDLTNWLLYVQSTDLGVSEWSDLVICTCIVRLFCSWQKCEAEHFCLGWMSILWSKTGGLLWNETLCFPEAWKSESNLHFSYSKAPLSLFTIVILRPPDWWNWIYSEALIVNFCSKLNYRHSPYFTFVIFCG